MKWDDYVILFEKIISGENNAGLYGDTEHIFVTKLNQTRMKRWLKTGEITEELKNEIDKINANQKWILITEPWCGDATHIAPFIYLASQLNSKVDLDINLRDGQDSEIENYLTNGSKSIPILIIRNNDGKDLAVWGSRPEKAKNFFKMIKKETSDVKEQKMKLQEWYNKDKGESFQNELYHILKNINLSQYINENTTKLDTHKV